MGWCQQAPKRVGAVADMWFITCWLINGDVISMNGMYYIRVINGDVNSMHGMYYIRVTSLFQALSHASSCYTMASRLIGPG